jgi:hypothetical protein
VMAPPVPVVAPPVVVEVPPVLLVLAPPVLILVPPVLAVVPPLPVAPPLAASEPPLAETPPVLSPGVVSELQPRTNPTVTHESTRGRETAFRRRGMRGTLSVEMRPLVAWTIRTHTDSTSSLSSFERPSSPVRSEQLAQSRTRERFARLRRNARREKIRTDFHG